MDWQDKYWVSCVQHASQWEYRATHPEPAPQGARLGKWAAVVLLMLFLLVPFILHWIQR